MPIIGRQCTRDLKTVCQRMSEASLPVNQTAPGLTLVYGWLTEDRKAQGIPASVQGIEHMTSTGKAIPLDHCPWCGSTILSSAGSVRTNAGSAPTPARAAKVEVAAPEPAPPVSRTKEVARREPEPPPPPQPARTMHVQGAAAAASAALKALREKLGISQAELGEKLGLARSTIANYENGRAPLSERLRKWMEKHEKKLAAKG